MIMTNKQYLEKYAPEYLKRIEDVKGEKCWWNFTKWVASFTFAGSFTMAEIEYAKMLIGVN